MQRFIIFFITVLDLNVSGGFSSHHQELKNCTHSICYVPGLLVVTASVDGFQLNSAHHQELKNCTHSICYVPGLLAATASVVEFQLNSAHHQELYTQHLLCVRLTCCYR